MHTPDASDHYFTARPASADERRSVAVQIAGRDVTVETAGGVFSPDHVDLGTQVLLRTVPGPPATGDLLDLGCGWGPVGLTLALSAPDARVWAVDVNERALDLVRRNAARLGASNLVAARPEEVPADVRFATVWSNPPVRIGKPALHALLADWLPRLAPDGDAWLVVGKNLGADPLQRWLASDAPDGAGLGLSVERVASAKGFRVLRVRR
ncbi:class I SAM-dependent methyltransferase [Cellulomonas shaoxiangyii]|uniref:Methyltransferase domain-containing protein n=1 Tax=Cellulomonas shaoxiangyii TaxID=2566013 RepID=A0A4P7SIP2_9CELL|nr:methyltransferase [Cellulomonas shaoxiangyii]QCB93920.1 methyltransferase domain-containing protein [Cellulomonas shaoxiangyii]TGY85993.1 methyltransferase domain-containing protein [Cellulomonas shaoxiangyii]